MLRTLKFRYGVGEALEGFYAEALYERIKQTRFKINKRKVILDLHLCTTHFHSTNSFVILLLSFILLTASNSLQLQGYTPWNYGLIAISFYLRNLF